MLVPHRLDAPHRCAQLPDCPVALTGLEHRWDDVRLHPDRLDRNDAVRSSCDHHRCPTSDSLDSTDCTEPLCATAGHRDRCAACCAEIGLHLGAVRRKLRSFADHRRRRVADGPAEIAYLSRNHAQQLE